MESNRWTKKTTQWRPRVDYKDDHQWDRLTTTYDDLPSVIGWRWHKIGRYGSARTPAVRWYRTISVMFMFYNVLFAVYSRILLSAKAAPVTTGDNPEFSTRVLDGNLRAISTFITLTPAIIIYISRHSVQLSYIWIFSATIIFKNRFSLQDVLRCAM